MTARPDLIDTAPSDTTIARLLAEGHAASVTWRTSKVDNGAHVYVLTVTAAQCRTTMEMTESVWRGLIDREIVESPGRRVRLGPNGHNLLSTIKREDKT